MTTIPQPEGAGAFPLPPLLTHQTSTPPTLITQGAEARLYHTTHLSPSRPAALKYRPPKPYRHPTLDARLTRSRILAEARVLAKCRREGCPVPALYALDEVAGWLMLEWIPGAPVRVRINEWLGERRTTAAIPEEGEETTEGGTGVLQATTSAPPAPKKDPTGIKNLMRRMGTAIGQMHKIGIVHGDLTTSNMMLRPPKSSDANGNNNDPLDGQVFIIDFGLASQSTSDEDRAVDLYVLERAFGSTHPRAEAFFQDVLDAYRDSYKQAPVTLKKLEDVRMRGRKRSMIG
ncbi:serine/threonine-protein kinase BUD32 [Colletotrichum scovillei]|uniref:EKC/KEOPS complex subunit BUD32 n=1 Tax=Colletotrichum scovillei TaxID=1209932 RepID=A0A9P7REX3_9PEZI|nr:serine/threonine-protein kinase BUD32 [Colletotrichum scovillei]KAF4785774.1 serine/threonine-protein kinase BUD32 [Colletotrichum scovillei]KAG7055423.1 EKC/KEOPS complex subunit BUD32 [Colletotrichum scovillei]KAG7074812.1 EKC/KEOPS complex subunit BUD32 [Colletotrichum scovillei]KAG7081903.1 EKC/KEOPS complex subunit BUD32 [Colletotrichum scovillei]